MSMESMHSHGQVSASQAQPLNQQQWTPLNIVSALPQSGWPQPGNQILASLRCPQLMAVGAGCQVTFCQRFFCSSLDALLTLSMRTCTFMSLVTNAGCMLYQ